MSILDENNFDKFVIENNFTIDDENYKDEHSIKIRRDNELSIILNQEAVTSYKPRNRNNNVIASMSILGKGQSRHILKNIYFYSLNESINLSYNKTKINSEAFVESIEWSSETFKNSEYIVEFIDNIENLFRKLVDRCRKGKLIALRERVETTAIPRGIRVIRRDPSLLEREVGVRDDEVGIEFLLCAEPGAFGTRAKGVVEGKEARLEFRDRDTAFGTGVLLGE